MLRLLRCVALFLFLVRPALAQDVTLSSPDGAIMLSGSLLTFDGEFYRISSDYGPLTVSADGVRCDGPGCPDLAAYVADLRLTGAPSIADALMPRIIEAFALSRGFELTDAFDADGARTMTLSRIDGSPVARFSLTSSSTDEAFLALLNDEADLALTLREPLGLEERAADAANAGGQSLAERARVIGLDALVPVTARSNPMAEISPETLAAVFSGALTNWSDLGGVDAPIRLHLPHPGSGLAQAFAARMFDDGMGPRAPAITRHSDLRDLSDAVARDPMALGLTTLSEVGNARAMALAGSCGFAVAATSDTLKSEDYPLTTPLFLFTPNRRLPRIARDFIGFLETAQAERVIRRAGYVSQSVTRTPMEEQGRRLSNAILAAGSEVTLADLQRLVSRMNTATRLSPTIRFSGGASTFDAQSRSAISRLARAIEQGMFDGRTLIFVGFSDGAGRASANLALSRNRADTVRRAVMEAAIGADLDRLTFRTTGFGEAMPMACDSSDWGAAINRRVEVWLE